jgi:hypothetical protein
MTTLDAEPELIEAAAGEAVRTYEDRYDEPVPVTKAELEDVLQTGPIANHDDVQRYMEEVGAYYEELLDVDADYVDELWEGVRYDPSPTEVVRDTLTPFGAAVAAAGGGGAAAAITGHQYAAQTVPWLNESVSQIAPPQLAAYSVAVGAACSLSINYLLTDGRYEDWRDWVGISSTKEEGPRAFWSVAAETFHGYQHDQDSPTLVDPLLTEGTERAASTKALAHKAALEDDPTWQQAADAFRSYVLSRGYTQFHTFRDEDDPGDALQQIGVTGEAADRLQQDLDSGDAEYNFPAATLLSLDGAKEGPVLADVFHGDVDDQLDPYRDRLGRFHRGKYRLMGVWQSILG